MPKKPVRVVIPTNPSAVIALLGRLKTKSDDLAEHSPLNDLDWTSITPAYERAVLHDAEADRLRKQAETEMGERNKHLLVINEAVRAARDVLLGVYRSNPKKLTEFGFEGNDSPAEASRTTTPAVSTLTGK